MVPQVLARDLVLRHAALGVERRRDRGEEAGVGQDPQADRGPRRVEQLAQLGDDPLARQVRPRDRREAASAARVAGSIVKSRPAARRAARSIRRASSPKRVAGSPTARRTRRSVSARPSNGSTRCGVSPGAPPQAIALTVKSRRARSTSTRSPNSTRCGRRKSAYSWSERNVVISTLGRPVARRDTDGHRPERVLVAGPREELDDPLRPCVGREIPVVGGPTEEPVAHAAARRRTPGGRSPAAGRRAPGRPAGSRRRRPLPRPASPGRPQFRPRKR